MRTPIANAIEEDAGIDVVDGGGDTRGQWTMESQSYCEACLNHDFNKINIGDEVTI